MADQTEECLYSQGEGVMIPDSRWKISREFENVGMTWDETDQQRKKMLGNFGTVLRTEAVNLPDGDLNYKVLVRPQDGEDADALWWPQSVVEKDDEDSDSDENSMDGSQSSQMPTLDRPGGSEIVLICVDNEDDDDETPGQENENWEESKEEDFKIGTDVWVHTGVDLDQPNKSDRDVKWNQARIIKPLDKEDPHMQFKVNVNGTAMNLHRNAIRQSKPPLYDIAYVTSAPLCYADIKNVKHPLDQLNLEREENVLRQCLDETKQQYKVVKCPATRHNLFDITNKGCWIIHFSGHGVRDALAFEEHSDDGIGDTHFIENRSLKSILKSKAGQTPVQLVVVSACHSENAGNQFVKAGVKHVIAIKKDSAVHDGAARDFTRTLYKFLFNGNTVQSSFNAAKKNVGLAREGYRADKGIFVLLPEDDPRHSEKVLFAKNPPPKGDYHFHDLNELPRHNLDAKITDGFVGRSLLMKKVVENICQKRLILLWGPKGIGKTELAKMAAWYVQERALEAATGGIVWVNIEKQYNAHHGVWNKAQGETAGQNQPALFGLLRHNVLNVLDKKVIHQKGLADPQLKMDQFVHKLPKKLLIIFDGIQYVTEKTRSSNHLEETQKLIAELHSTESAPTILMTNWKNYQPLKNTPVSTIKCPGLDVEVVSRYFASKGIFKMRQIREPLASDSFENDEKKTELHWDEQYTAGGGDIKDLTFADWLGNNPRRINGIVNFIQDKWPKGVKNEPKAFAAHTAGAEEMIEPWDVITGWNEYDKDRKLRQFLEIEPVTNNMACINRLFQEMPFINVDNRMEYEGLKKICSARIKAKTRREMQPSDWATIEKEILVNCTNAKDLSVSRSGMIHLFRFIFWLESMAEGMELCYKYMGKNLPDEVIGLVDMGKFFNVTQQTVWNQETVTSMNQQWNNILWIPKQKGGMAMSAEFRVPLEFIKKIIPAVICEKYPKIAGKRQYYFRPGHNDRVGSKQVDYVKDVILEKFITKKHSPSVSFNGWAHFCVNWLEIVMKMIIDESYLWEKYLFWGFGSRADIHRWLQPYNNPESYRKYEGDVCMIRFSRTKLDAVALVYTDGNGAKGQIRESLITFVSQQQNVQHAFNSGNYKNENYWHMGMVNEKPVKGKNFVDILEGLNKHRPAYKIVGVYNPVEDKVVLLEDLKEKKKDSSLIYVNIGKVQTYDNFSSIAASLKKESQKQDGSNQTATSGEQGETTQGAEEDNDGFVQVNDIPNVDDDDMSDHELQSRVQKMHTMDPRKSTFAPKKGQQSFLLNTGAYGTQGRGRRRAQASQGGGGQGGRNLAAAPQPLQLLYTQIASPEHQQTPLIEAVKRNLPIAQIQTYIHLNYIDKADQTALMFAAHMGNVEAVKLLLHHLEFGADYINLKNANGATALGMACQKGHVQIVKLLLDKGHRKRGDENMIAAANGRRDIVDLLNMYK